MPQTPVPDPQSAPQSLVLGDFAGMKNTVDLHELKPNELELALNVDIDDVGHLTLRRGYTQVAVGNFHSLLQADNGRIYGVMNDVLGRIYPNYSFLGLLSGIGVDPSQGGLGLVGAQVGSNLYFTSATNSGIIDTTQDTISDWGDPQDYWLSPVVNPTTTLPAIRGKLLGKPPLATTIAYYNGRLYLGQGNLVWATELFLYNYVDKTRTFFNFEGRVTMLGTVMDGVYVGTDEGLWFLEGPAFPLKRRRVMDCPVIPGSMVYIPAELANPPQVGLGADTELQVSIAFMTTTGFCVAEDGGKAYNLTESKFFFPTMVRASAAYRRQDGINQYLLVADSEGQPVNNARIGDFVEADIIRGNARWTDACERVRIYDAFTPQWSTS